MQAGKFDWHRLALSDYTCVCVCNNVNIAPFIILVLSTAPDILRPHKIMCVSDLIGLQNRVGRALGRDFLFAIFFIVLRVRF